jgi:hypothetical protein
MKKFSLVLALVLVLTLSGCAAISEEDYDALMAEKTALESEKADLEAEVSDLEDELEAKMVGYVDQTVEAYGFTHGGYVGQVTIVVTDGVLDVEINEAFLPHTLAEVDLADAEWTEANTLDVDGDTFALFIEYNGEIFKAVATESNVLVYSAVDENGDFKSGRGTITNLEMDIIKNDANMKAYYDALNGGEFKLLKSFDDASPIVVDSGQFKDGNPNYWPAGGDRLGWQANIDATEAFLEEYGAAYDTLAFTQVTATINDVEDTYWQIADAVAGATNSDFPDYFQLAQAAFGQLETEVQ